MGEGRIVPSAIPITNPCRIGRLLKIAHFAKCGTSKGFFSKQNAPNSFELGRVLNSPPPSLLTTIMPTPATDRLFKTAQYLAHRC
jgi:hypothetical protein